MIDITGKKFGKLTVLGYSHNKRGQSYWTCECECGNKKIVRAGHLFSGGVRSCGCLLKNGNKTHGLWSRSKRLYKSWNTMIQRCENIKNTHFWDYGGRGIKVCNDWHDPLKFEKWALENGYNDNLTIDRIDVNGDYCSENCRWATIKQQAQNKRNSHYITINGDEKCLAEWLRYFKTTRGCFHRRVKSGMDEITALKMPSRRRRAI